MYVFITLGSDVPPSGGSGRSARSAYNANGLDVADAVYNARSSIRRVSEHHKVPAEVCDGQHRTRSDRRSMDAIPI